MECLRSAVIVGSWGIIKGNVLSYLVIVVVAKKKAVAIVVLS